MQRILDLLRHAKSDWSQNVTDYERPLNKRGERAAERMGRWMSQHDSMADQIVSSPATRARLTASLVCMATGYDEQAIDWDERIYEASVTTLLDVLAGYADGPQSVMLIGHNPGFESLLRYLGGDSVAKHDSAKLMPTAALARLNMPSNWNELDSGCAEVISIIKPKELTK